MDQQTIKALVDELRSLLVGRMPGKVFQLNPLSLAIDFRLRDSRYLLISVEPALPRLHLIERRVRDLEKSSLALTPFAQLLKKELSNTKVESIEKHSDDRIVRFSFAGRDDFGENIRRTVVAQLTGRVANLFLLDEGNKIIGLLRAPLRSGQRVGDIYEIPARGTSPIAGSPTGQPAWGGAVREGLSESSDSPVQQLFHTAKFPSLSAAADAYYTSLTVKKAFDARTSTARAQLRKEISRNQTLLKNLRKDLASHANSEQQKQIGDLLLANLTTAERHGSIVKLVDYFADDAPTIEVEIDEHSSLQEEAARRFNSYSRSKRAVPRIKSRIATVETALKDLQVKQSLLDKIIAESDEVAFENFVGKGKAQRLPAAKRKVEAKIPGVRRYLSSDGYEILVGRTSRDNDRLTFKVARPNDLWLHAGDYPGSHVVVRNATRKKMPQRTIIEAAQLAAYFSRARKDTKVAIHYTQRKFLSKPKGAAPGLVRLSRFKTMNVEPKESVPRLSREVP